MYHSDVGAFPSDFTKASVLFFFPALPFHLGASGFLRLHFRPPFHSHLSRSEFSEFFSRQLTLEVLTVIKMSVMRKCSRLNVLCKTKRQQNLQNLSFQIFFISFSSAVTLLEESLRAVLDVSGSEALLVAGTSPSIEF